LHAIEEQQGTQRDAGDSIGTSETLAPVGMIFFSFIRVKHSIVWLTDFYFRLRNWETWHWLAKYIPLAPAWLLFCVRARSLWFFTPSNPTLTFGGFDGESKKEMYDQLPPGSFPKTIYIKHAQSFDEVLIQFEINRFTFPVAVKPDVGRMGFLFRKVNSPEEMRLYHSKMPVDYLLQEFVHYPIEVSVFYYRFPNEKKGAITGFVRKDYLEVTGNGTSTLRELIENYPRVRFRKQEMFCKHADQLKNVVPKGEVYYLSHALNLSRGGKLVSLDHEKDDRLLQLFDDLSFYAKHFYYGRYDIKCSSIEALKEGKEFTILEYNGSGAEPHHVYGNGKTFFEAIKILFEHWNILFQISRHNHLNGFPYWSFTRGYRQLREAGKHISLLKKLDNDPGMLRPM
jgi:hypothetical protein